MSTPSAVIYSGLKFSVSEEEVEALRKGEHASRVTARKLGLDCYWRDFGTYEEEYGVFIGKELGRVGCEDDWNQEMSESELVRIIETTKAALKKADFTEEPKLLIHFDPDI